MLSITRIIRVSSCCCIYIGRVSAGISLLSNLQGEIWLNEWLFYYSLFILFVDPRKAAAAECMLYCRYGRRWPLFCFHMTTSVVLFIKIFIPAETGERMFFSSDTLFQWLRLSAYSLHCVSFQRMIAQVLLSQWTHICIYVIGRWYRVPMLMCFHVLRMLEQSIEL